MSSNPAAEYLSRRERNLAFFRKHYADIYQHFVDYRIKHTRLNILTGNHEVDLIGPEGSLYNSRGKAYAEREVHAFKNAFAPGKPLYTVGPITSGGFIHPRFMHRRLRELVLPYQPDILKESYFIDFYPLVVFMGIGLGLQIEILCRQEKIQHAIFAEPDPDKFAASLYTVEWEEICGKLVTQKGHSARFIIGKFGDPEHIYPDVWNALVGLCPVYPAGTMFFVHRGDKACNRIVDRMNENMTLYLNSWGNYDDEIRQLNNALHSFHLKVPLLPRQIERAKEVPVFIVGNGPSLDDRVEYIRKLRDRALVISCGTALRSLLKYGVEPDFHVELESDYASHRVLAATEPETLKRLRLISVTHVCPLHFSLFGQSRIYFKKENAVAEFFGEGQKLIQKGVPTCVNAALALSIELGFTDLYLFGTDFGYRSKEYHHAKTSIYQAEDKGVLEGLVGFNPSDELQVEGWRGDLLSTQPIYFSTLRMVERVITEVRQDGRDLNVYACADGAKIDGTKWLSNNQLEDRLASSSVDPKMAVLEQLFSTKAQPLSLDRVSARLEFAAKVLAEGCERLKKILRGEHIETVWDMSRCCSWINHFLENEVQARSPGLYYLIRGTMRSWIFVGFTYSWMISEPDRRRQFVTEWSQAFLAALDALPDHFSQVVDKSFDIESDPWVHQSINDPELSAS